MGEVIALHHARASINTAASLRRPAIAVIASAVSPDERATTVARIGAHHSDGMLSRCHHLDICAGVAPLPMSEAQASRVAQSSMIARNDFMPTIMGQAVPKSKAIMSGDCGWSAGHNVPMREEDKAESEWRDGFQSRLIAAQGHRTNAVMAELLGISETRYSKYRGARKSMLPIRLLPKFCKICGITLEYLIEGGKEPAEKPVPKRVKRPEAPRKNARNTDARSASV
jgi:transcriptional regulator with XRE-family HTH domain